MNAVNEMQRMDLRRRKAEALTAALMRELDEVIEDFDRRTVFDHLFKVLHENGAGWTTDEERAAYGLEPRDQMGWTPSEAVADKLRRMELMYAMQPLFMPV